MLMLMLMSLPVYTAYAYAYDYAYAYVTVLLRLILGWISKMAEPRKPQFGMIAQFPLHITSSRLLIYFNLQFWACC